jgi:hypothetical protein
MTDAGTRGEMLEALAEAADALGDAVAALGDAYDHVDDFAADRLEETLFKPAQAAYARARRTHTEFAQRFGLTARSFTPREVRGETHRAAPRIEEAVEAVRTADEILVELQDSMRPVEFGDVELRKGMSETRELMAPLARNAREFLRTLGR